MSSIVFWRSTCVSLQDYLGGSMLLLRLISNILFVCPGHNFIVLLTAEFCAYQSIELCAFLGQRTSELCRNQQSLNITKRLRIYKSALILFVYDRIDKAQGRVRIDVYSYGYGQISASSCVEVWASLATPLATVVAVAVAANSETARRRSFLENRSTITKIRRTDDVLPMCYANQQHIFFLQNYFPLNFKIVT